MSADTIALFSPGSSDWIVTLQTKDGRRITRRISPGKIDEETAVKCALNSSEVTLANLDFYMARRADDRSLVANGEEFLAALRAKRR
jgi:hypothetical protein